MTTLLQHFLLLKSLPSDQVVSLTANQNKLTLQGGKSRFVLQTLPAEDFPLVQEAADFEANDIYVLGRVGWVRMENPSNPRPFGWINNPK